MFFLGFTSETINNLQISLRYPLLDRVASHSEQVHLAGLLLLWWNLRGIYTQKQLSVIFISFKNIW
jgi:hypothetical protein